MYWQLIVGTSLFTLASISLAGNLKPDRTAPEDAYLAHLRNSPRLELPARAAALVREAPPAQRPAVAVTVTKIAVALAPTARPTIVLATTREAPQAAAAIAAAAGGQQRGHAVENPARLRPPFVPGGGTPGEVHRKRPVIVQPGRGRCYSAP